MSDITSPYVPKRHREIALVPDAPSDEQVRAMLGRDAGTIDEVIGEGGLQRIAREVAALTYGDMKELAKGILAKDDHSDVIALADQLHLWSQRARAPA